MGKYDPDKDIVIAERTVCEGEYKVTLNQYDGGEKKIGILKHFLFEKNGEVVDTYGGKIGRMKIADAIAVTNAVTELIKHAEEG